MPLDIGLWRLDDGIQRLLPTGMPSEKRLEGLIETDPSVLMSATGSRTCSSCGLETSAAGEASPLDWLHADR